MLRERKVERERARVFTATATVASGEEAQGIEDTVTPTASVEMETKIDDAPRNAKELHAHEEYEEILPYLRVASFPASRYRRMKRWMRSGRKINECCGARWSMLESTRASCVTTVRSGTGSSNGREDWQQRAQVKSSRSTLVGLPSAP
jgi:hypothetical protein